MKRTNTETTEVETPSSNGAQQQYVGIQESSDLDKLFVNAV